MGQSIAIMNTKGGVGKSTLVMTMAETLSVYHGKNVLVIDSDAQTSISIMLTAMARWEEMEREKRTLVEFLAQRVLADAPADWKSHIIAHVSDVDDAKSVWLIPSHMNLTLFEREVSAERKHAELRGAIRNLLREASGYFDYILIDCPPGLSVLTECWLREATFYLPPTKADYLSVRGLEILKRFKDVSAKHGFADLIGVLVNQKDETSATENAWHDALLQDPANRCLPSGIPRRAYIQRAADFDAETRTFQAKYPGDAGHAAKEMVQAMLDRMALINRERQSWTGQEADLSARLDEIFAEQAREALSAAQAGGTAAPAKRVQPVAPVSAPVIRPAEPPASAFAHKAPAQPATAPEAGAEHPVAENDDAASAAAPEPATQSASTQFGDETQRQGETGSDAVAPIDASSDASAEQIDGGSDDGAAPVAPPPPLPMSTRGSVSPLLSSATHQGNGKLN
ncbi:MAG: AAA family ATPase [Pseudomonadota bacterium]